MMWSEMMECYWDVEAGPDGFTPLACDRGGHTLFTLPPRPSIGEAVNVLVEVRMAQLAADRMFPPSPLVGAA